MMIKINPKILFKLFTVFLLVLISITHLNNFIKYSVYSGFDAEGHLEYINFIKNNHSIPLANQGWEFYQPPLYYITTSLLPSPNLYKIINLIGLTTLAIGVYLYFKKTKPDHSLNLTTLVLSLPVVLYTAPALSNEFISGVLITVNLIFYIHVKPSLSEYKHQIILGVLLGLAILTKATAWVLVFSIIFDLVLDNLKNLKAIIRYWLLPLVLLLVGGWFYLRNIYYFSNPFVSSVDFPQYQFWQPPGYRDLQFFITFEGFTKLDLFTSHWYSLLSGTYFSWFYDGHNNVLPIQTPSTSGKIIAIMSIPFFIAAVHQSLHEFRQRNSQTRILFTYSLLLTLTYILYNLKLPYYSTVKGSFIISLILPFIHYTSQMLSKFRKYHFISTLYICIYIIIISKHFWILNT